MTDLVAWLLQQIDEDERLAQAAYAGPWAAAEDPYGADSCCSPEDDTWQVTSADPVQVDVTWHGHEGGGVSGAANARHIARWDPARVLADCAARRAIIAYNDRWGENNDVLYLLAQPYADHPEFEPAWLVGESPDTSNPRN